MTDERHGLPSASGAERLALCPGSWQAERVCPPSQSGADAESGNAIHAALAGERYHRPLTDEESDCVDKCAALERGLVGSERGVMLREERLWLTRDGKRTASGKPDVLWLVDDTATVIDFKTGRNEVTHATGNLQLRWLAVLVAENFPVSRVTVAIIQPWASPQLSTCDYDADALATARAEMLAILERAGCVDAPRVPGEAQCRYCRALATCPEAQRTLAVTIEAGAGKLDAPTPEQVGNIAANMTAGGLAMALNRVALAEMVCEALREEARRRLAEGLPVPGWELKPGAMKSKIVDVPSLFTRAAALGITGPQFAAACSMTKTALKDMVKTATGEKGKALDARLADLTAGLTEETQSAASLKHRDPSSATAT